MLRKLGNETLLQKRKTAFLCSRITPEETQTAVLEWVNSLNQNSDCILCGNHSAMEHLVFGLLLRKKIPTILVLAETFKDNWNNEIISALKENRLLIITLCDETVHFVSKQSAADRNLLILSLAENIVIGYSTPNGNIERQTENLHNVSILTQTPLNLQTTHTQENILSQNTETSILHRVTKKINSLLHKLFNLRR